MVDTTHLTWRVVTDAKSGCQITRGGEEDRADALGLRSAIYCEELGYKWDAPEDEYDDGAFLCVFRTPDSQPIGSLRIVRPEQRPFEVEKYVRIDDLLPQDSRPAEVNRFCVLPPFRSVSSLVHVAAFKFVFGLADDQGYSHFVVASKPSIEPIYRFLLFEPVEGRSFEHKELGGDLHNLMLLDLRVVAHRYREARHPFANLLPNSP
jgi:Acetyltransferase (GNAT) domain